jgi:multisubunit Na+/H+ antiporter MnhC subunit
MKSRKFSTAEIMAVVFCAIGISLFVASRFIKSDVDLFVIGLGLTGIGILVFIVGRNSGKD